MSDNHARLLGVILATLALACDATAACEDAANSVDCETDKAVEAVDSAPAQAKNGYTWEELVAAIPQLSKFELSFSPSSGEGDDEGAGTYLLCQMKRARDSRIKRRVCMPLVDYLAYVSGSENGVDDQRRLILDVLNRQTPAPVSSFSLKAP